MSPPKHTPGPWTAMNGTFYIKVVAQNGRVVLSSQNQGTSAEDEANSRLIAAATDMLFAIDVAEKWFSSKGRITKSGMESIRKLLEDARKKATSSP